MLIVLNVCSNSAQYIFVIKRFKIVHVVINKIAIIVSNNDFRTDHVNPSLVVDIAAYANVL